MQKLAMITAALVIGLPALATAGRPDCEPARCAVQTAIAAQCPSCDGAGNHGRYVSCVAHIVKQLVADGTVPGNCKGKVVSCAARSTCGKPGFVRCLFPTDTCVVDPATGLGTCAANPALACVTDLDCGAKCKTKSSADRCTTHGGTVGGSGSCCASCASPSGAFVEGQF
jgi:hypothetical protein